ncbi:MAG: hypothetical protein AB7S75_05310 [Desulfococcaceae bacterium]
MKEKVGTAVLRDLKDQTDTLMQAKEPLLVHCGFFAHEGLTDESFEYEEKQGVLCSDRKYLDDLLVHPGLRPLPEM